MTRNQIVSRLLAQDETLQGFALRHGYKPRTVQQAVTRYAATKRTPRGVLTTRILRDLSREIGQPIVPGLFPEETP